MTTRRILLTLALLAALTVGAAQGARAARYAVLVGIDSYPFIKDADLQLHGAQTDLDQMGLVLQVAGFETVRLQGKQATGAAIRQALQAAAARAAAGDQVLFYYSGRGSVDYDPVRADKTEDLEPTLVPVDGNAGGSIADVPMSVLEQWAKDVAGRGAGATIVLDTCYSAPAPRGEDRFYKDVPRCVRRPGKARATLFEGDALVMAATDTRGQAYEWRVDFNTDTWAGAFTDLWTNIAIRRLRKGPPPSGADILREIHGFFAAREGYMPGTRPVPSAAQLTAAYDKPLFGIASPPTPPAPVLEKADAVAAKTQAREQTLRIAVEAGTFRNASEAASAVTPLQERLRQDLEMVTVLPKYSDRPDRLVIVQKRDDAWTARVLGDEVDSVRQPEFRGADIGALMEAGLEAYLQRQAYVLRLYQKAAPTGTADWKARSEKSRYKPGDRFAFMVETPRDGLLYLLDRDEKDGIVQMVWPLDLEPDNRVGAGSVTIPRKVAFQIAKEQRPGRTSTRAILLIPKAGVKLPPLPPAGVKPAEYAAAERAHLRAVLGAMDTGHVEWSAVDFEYEVGR